MKKIFTIVAMAAFAAVSAMAETATDVSALTDCVYMEKTTVNAGQDAVLSFKMKNADAVQCVGVYGITLPAGFTIADDGVVLSAERTTTEAHTLAFSKQSANVCRVGVLNQKAAAFSGSDGVLFTVKCNVPANQANGDYSVKLSGVEFSNAASGAYKTTNGKKDCNDVVAVVTVVGGTGINDIDADASQAMQPKKMVKNGQIVIVNGESELNVAGAQVK